jgi:hypothetical protein
MSAIDIRLDNHVVVMFTQTKGYKNKFQILEMSTRGQIAHVYLLVAFLFSSGKNHNFLIIIKKRNYNVQMLQ